MKREESMEQKKKYVTPARKRRIKDDPRRRCKYDFGELNQAWNDAWRKYKSDRTDANRILFYQAIFDMSWACIDVSRWRFNPEFDKRMIATEYAFEVLHNVMSGKLNPEPEIEGTLFPANHYVSLAIQHTADSYFRSGHAGAKKWARVHNLVDDLELFVTTHAGIIADHNIYSADFIEKSVTRTQYTRDLFRTLNLFYSEVEIRRMLPLAAEMMSLSNFWHRNGVLKSLSPETMDLKTFMDILIVCAQRLAVTHEISDETRVTKRELKNVLEASLRSTLFLSAVTNYDKVPKDLLLALDHRSLYRLAYILGGSTVRIPTVRDLESMKCAVNAAVEYYMAPEKERGKLMRTLKNYEDVFEKQRGMLKTEAIVSRMIKSSKVLQGEETSSPLINVVLAGIRALDAVVQRVQATQFTTNKMVDEYVQLSKSLMEIVDRITSLEERGSNESA